MTKDNHLLGNFELSGLPPAPRGIPKIDVTFDIDANGILSVTAEEKATGKQNRIVITNDKGRLTKDEIDKMISDAEKFKEEDETNRLVCGCSQRFVPQFNTYKTPFHRLRIAARNGLESYCLDLLGSVQHLSDKDKEVITKEANEGLKWLEKNGNANKQQIDDKKSSIEKTCSPIIAALYNRQGSGSKINVQKGEKKKEQSGPTIEEAD